MCTCFWFHRRPPRPSLNPLKATLVSGFLVLLGAKVKFSLGHLVLWRLVADLFSLEPSQTSASTATLLSSLMPSPGLAAPDSVPLSAAWGGSSVLLPLLSGILSRAAACRLHLPSVSSSSSQKPASRLLPGGQTCLRLSSLCLPFLRAPQQRPVNARVTSFSVFLPF